MSADWFFNLKKRACALGCALFLLSSSAWAVDDSLQTIHNPGGGEIVYGAVSGQSTLQGAMGFMLRQVHGHFGDKPQVGKFFHTKGSDSIATFFTLTAKNQGNKPMAGMVVVSLQGGQPTAAVIYDDAQRFATTANPMMKKLNEVWHPAPANSSKSAAGASQGSAPVAALHQTAFPDNSGSIGLPEGWKIAGAQQGTVQATGPNGEFLVIGMYVPVMDPNNPQQRQMIQMETQGGRMPLPGMYVAVPYGTDPFQTLKAVSAQLHAKQRQQPASIELIDTQKQANNCNLFNAHVDQHDGKGVMYTSIYMCIQPPFMPGTYAVTINQVSLPEPLLAKENPTLHAIFQSYRTNDAVINAETRQNIDNIHAIGERAKIQADASHAAWDIHQQAYQNQQDSQDRNNAAFSNYLLDQTVIQDSQRNERGTVYNQYADALVKADPSRYQYVPTQDFLKGIDY